jgi:rubrerythrin
VGGRSRVAAQLLSGRGFEEVYNLAGGIKAWDGAQVTGPADVGMNLISGNESPAEMLAIAYAMEEGLRSFYERMDASVSDQDAAEAFRKLAAMDTQHKEMIFDLYKKNQGEAETTEDLEKEILPKIMEGGMTTDEFLAANQPSLETAEDVTILAMMLEAQALDLYSRYSFSTEDPETKRVLHELANEEKMHLALLGDLQEKY